MSIRNKKTVCEVGLIGGVRAVLYSGKHSPNRQVFSPVWKSTGVTDGWTDGYEDDELEFVKWSENNAGTSIANSVYNTKFEMMKKKIKKYMQKSFKIDIGSTQSKSDHEKQSANTPFK